MIQTGMFDACTEKHRTVKWNGITLALLEEPYLETGSFGGLCFYAEAVDVNGNVWYVKWEAILDVDGCPVCNLDSPVYAEMTDEWF